MKWKGKEQALKNLQQEQAGVLDDIPARKKIFPNLKEAFDAQNLTGMIDILTEHYGPLYAITVGKPAECKMRAALVMKAILKIGESNEDAMLESLADGDAVFQLCRNGQAKAVWNILPRQNQKTQAQILGAYGALFGLLHYGPEQGITAQNVADMVFAMPAELREKVEVRPEDKAAPESNRLWLKGFKGYDRVVKTTAARVIVATPELAVA